MLLMVAEFGCGKKREVDSTFCLVGFAFNQSGVVLAVTFICVVFHLMV
jgi:hypothetical protein